MTRPSSTDIERIHAPSREELMRWVDRNHPVVITGVADQWPAFHKWGPDYFREVAGDAEVTVHYDERGDFQRWYTPSGRDDRTLTLREFVDILTAEPPDRRFYMTEHDLSLISQRLCEDVDGSRYADGEPRIFLGRNTCMPLHYHATTEAILCQLQGHKEILLYSPEQFPLLYAHPWQSNAWMFSQVDGPQQIAQFTRDTDYLKLDAPPSDGFPKFKKAVPTIVNLAPGEILLIPVQWWHLTTCEGFQFNVTFFWRSTARRYTFPQPGLQVFAHEWLNKAKRTFRRKPTLTGSGR